MRVCIATYDDDPPEGGQGVYVRGLRAALQQRGVEVTTVAGRGAHAVAYRRVLHRAPLDLSVALNRNATAMLRSAPDVVHAQGGPGGVLLLRRLPVPLVYTAHHTYRQAYATWLAPRRSLAWLERRAYARAAAVLAVSPSTAAAVRAMGVRGRVEVVPPGVDVDALGARGESVRDAGLLLFVGRLEDEKGVLDAVTVMQALARERPDVHGVVVGRGSLERRVRGLATTAGGHTVEVAGALPDDAVHELYARAAVVLVPSRYEGLGLVALEAMAAGAAVVGYDVTGLRDAVGDGGLLVPPGDVAALVAAARSLLTDPSRRAEVAARGRERVAPYRWSDTAARVEAIYREVLAGRA
jgi:glycosyltransferase involved in cell wall biosynthesis